MRKARKHSTAEERVAILRRHLLDKEPVSTLCDELTLQPTVFYRWQKEFFENGAALFGLATVAVLHQIEQGVFVKRREGTPDKAPHGVPQTGEKKITGAGSPATNRPARNTAQPKSIKP